MSRRIIYKCKVGSHLYGLTTPESDEDFNSVFIPSNEDLLGLNPVKEIDSSTKKSNEDRRNTKDDIDDKAYALPHFVKLLLQNNPNIVELLFVKPENIIICEPEFQELIDNYHKVISTKILHTFTGYAFSQRKKLMVKKERYGNLCTAVANIERDFGEIINLPNKTPVPITDTQGALLNSWVKYYKGAKNNCESFHKGMDLHMIYAMLTAERGRYGWRVKTTSFAKLGYCTKFAYHLIRILAEGAELLETGKLTFPITGTARYDIMRIRNQEVSYEELMAMCDAYNSICEGAAKHSELPHKPDFNWVNDYLIATLENNIVEEVFEDA